MFYSLKYIWQHAASARTALVWCLILSAIHGFFVFAIPYMLSQVVDAYLNYSLITIASLFIFAVFVEQFVGYFIRKVGESLGPTLSLSLKTKYVRQFYQLYLKQKTQTNSGYLIGLIDQISRSVTDLVFALIWHLPSGFVTLLLFLIYLADHSLALAFVNIVLLGITLGISFYYSRKSVPFIHRQNKSTAFFQERFIDVMSHMKSLVFLGKAKYGLNALHNAYDGASADVWSHQAFHAKRWFIVHTFFGIAFLATSISLIYLIQHQNAAPSLLIVFVAAYNTLRNHLGKLSELYKGVYEVNDHIKTLDQLMPLKEIEPLNELSPFRNWKTLSLSNVHFSHPKSKTTLTVPELSISPGDTIFISGASGQGKSTLLKLIGGFLSNYQGDIQLDGMQIASIDPRHFRDNTVVLAPEVGFLDIPVRDNILFDQDMTDEELYTHLESFLLRDPIEKLPQKLSENIGEKAHKLSTGQAQRINILRACLMEREIYFFDEPTANLDAETEEKVIQLMARMLKGKTYIISAHNMKLKNLCNKHYKVENHCLIED